MSNRRLRGWMYTGIGLALVGLSGCDWLASKFPSTDKSGKVAPAAAQSLAHLFEVKGQVTLERAGQKAPTGPAYLQSGDVVETGPESAAKIRLAGGKTLEVGADARFVLTRDAQGLLLEVTRGLVLSRVPEEAPPQDPKLGSSLTVTIATPFGLTRLSADPHEVAVDVGKGTVDVLLGTVEFVGKDGEAVPAKAGQRLEIAAGKVEIVSREPSVLELKPLVVNLTADGKTEIRKNGQRQWRPLARGGGPLQPGDEVRVKTGQAQAALEGSDTQLTALSGSELKFIQANGSKEVQASALDLKKGMAIFSAPGQKVSVESGGIFMQSDLGGAFTLTRTSSGVAVQVLAGDWTLKKGDASQPLKPGETADVGAGEGAIQVKPAEPKDDLLVLPSRAGLQVFHSGLPTATLTWEGAVRDYHVEVASDAGFTKKVLAGRVHLPKIQVPIPARGALFWRVTDVETQNPVDNGSARFGPEVSGRDLARLRNEVPEGKEKTTVYFQDKPPAITFTFAAETGADSYVVKVFDAAALDKPLVERTGTTNRVPLEAGILEEGNYLWSVTPLSATGAELRGGRLNKLEMVYDNTVASLIILSPRNGEKKIPKVRTTGIAPVNSNLIINGRTVPLDEKHRFNVLLSPAGSPPSLVYRLIRPSSPDVFTVRTLAQRR